MFIKICEALEFPTASLAVLEKSYLSVTENTEANTQFQIAIDSLLHPNEVLFNEATAKIVEITNLHPYTLNIVLCVSSIEPLGKIYEEASQRERFDMHVKTLTSKLVSCKEKFGVWGIEIGFWQWMFHELNCITLGRLEYEPFHHFCDVPYKKIVKGDPVILIHIPRGKSLDIDEVMESLSLGYEHFKDRFENGIVPFMTHTWLLYPPFLREVFKEGGNIQRFAELFDIISENTSSFQNFQTVFGCPYPGEDLGNVPRETSLQRNMLKFLMQGNKMGEGYGIFLYGKNGIVKER